MRLRLLGTILTLALLAGCGPAEQPLLVPVERFIATGPRPLYRPDLVLRPRERFVWRPGEAAELARWQATGPDAGTTARGHLAVVGSPSGSVSLSRRTRIEAPFIDSVVVVLETISADDPDSGDLSLSWAGIDGSMSPRRRLTVRAGEALADGARRYRFPVGSHPDWRGLVGRLALDFSLPPSGQVGVARIAGLSERSIREQLTFVALGSRSFDGAPGSAEWHVERTPAGDWAEGTERMTLWRETDLEADALGTLEAVIRSNRTGAQRYTVLLWAGAGEGFTSERSLAVSTGEKIDEHNSRYDFRVGRHPAWRGRVARLGLRVFAKRGEEIELSQLQGYAEEIRPEHVASVAGGFDLILDDEARPALLATDPVERRLTVPAGARLHFAYGVEGEVMPPPRFEVSLAPDGDVEHSLLWEGVPNPATDIGWRDVIVDLSPWEGRTVDLRLSTTAAAPIDLRRGFPAWGGPEILAPIRERPVSLVLVSIDTLRADRLSLYGHGRRTSPRLDAWSDRATVFESVVAPSPWTLPSHISLLTGLDAHRHGGKHFLGTAPATLPLLPEILREGRHTTLAVTGGGILDPSFGFARGFDRYRFFSGGAGDADELDRSLDTALDWLEEHREIPFFLFFHTYEVHAPFRARQPWFDLFTDLEAPPEPVPVKAASEGPEAGFLGRTPLEVPGRTPEEAAALIGALYDSGVAYADDRIGHLLDRLAELGLDERTVIAVTSDHGELLGEHGLANHGYLDDANLLVPLLVATPNGTGAGRRVTRQVRLHDLFPTLLELLGKPVPRDIDGRSLVPLLEGRKGEVPKTAMTYASSTNHGLALRLDNRLKYVLNNTAWSPLQGRERFYLLEAGLERAVDADEIPQATRLRQEARRVLEEETPGLRMRFRNETDLEVRGSVRGALVQPVKVKSAEMGCNCFEWAGPDEATFRVPPGRSFTVSFENTRARILDLEIDGSRTEGAGLRHRFLTARLKGRTTVGLAASGWRVLEPGEESAASVAFWWAGQNPEEAAIDDSPDPLLRERLRALGYVE